MHEFGHVFGRDEAVRFAAFRAEEAVAFLVGDNEAGDKVHFAGDAVAALAVAHELPGAEHGFQAVLQAVAFFAVHGEGFGDLREGERFALRFQPAEDVFAAGQGGRAVFALFAGVVGVFRPPVFCVLHGVSVSVGDGVIPILEIKLGRRRGEDSMFNTARRANVARLFSGIGIRWF
ncbi:hypothetical protein HMPREF9080_01065 [Cardiobacterium valvarum F0432]|uniref:Uncharacterized protein n=1 Tax=Cardiobacterium valvarum F0432 TaxID=797473 RepID=G9ZE82_9GAMM|nr:hypothetical protein HMPREF9080_01065 [Cardiobacterium valvarum F0432]